LFKYVNLQSFECQFIEVQCCRQHDFFTHYIYIQTPNQPVLFYPLYVEHQSGSDNVPSAISDTTWQGIILMTFHSRNQCFNHTELPRWPSG